MAAWALPTCQDIINGARHYMVRGSLGQALRCACEKGFTHERCAREGIHARAGAEKGFTAQQHERHSIATDHRLEPVPRFLDRLLGESCVVVTGTDRIPSTGSREMTISGVTPERMRGLFNNITDSGPSGRSKPASPSCWTLFARLTERTIVSVVVSVRVLKEEEAHLFRISPTIVVYAILVLGLGSGCYSPSDDPGTEAARLVELPPAPCVTPDGEKELGDAVLVLINQQRSKRSLRPVKANRFLKSIAEGYACRMVEGQFFDHRDPATGAQPRDRAIEGKYRGYAIGENLAAGQQTPEEVVQVWMESPSHRNIILDPMWRDVGIGVRGGGEYSIYWVLEFGDPLDF